MTTTLDPEKFNLELETCVLTEREQTKTLPCRRCRRPCVVTLFAAAAKTCCPDCHKHRHDLAISELDPSIFDLTREPHHLTENEQTRWLPCTVCNRPCRTSLFAAKAKVRCFEHPRQSGAPTVPRQRPRLDPFELLISDDERAARLIGRKVTVRIRLDGIECSATHLVSKLRSYDPESGVIRLWALHGGQRVIHQDDILEIR